MPRALAFAARATSSFPGAFPPARIVEMDEVVAQRQADLAAARRVHRQGLSSNTCAPSVDPATASFIDGAVLNNRPFQQAISAIHGRPAYRQVDRRLVYIDPHPAPPASPRRQQVPGFFATLRGALSDIPSSQPVTDELGWVIEFNDQVRRLRAIIDSARPQVSQLVAKVVTDARSIARSPTDELRGWREQVNAQVARDAGFAYQAYVRLKLASVRAFGAELIVKLRGVPPQSPLARVVAEIIDAWAMRKGIVYERADSEALEFETADRGSAPALGEVPPRLRRQIPRTPPAFSDRGAEPALPACSVRSALQASIRSWSTGSSANSMRASTGFGAARGPHSTAPELRALVADIFPGEPSSGEVKHLAAYASRFVEQHADKLDRLIERLAAEIDLDAKTRDLDDLLASLDPDEWHPDARREVLVNYLGFPFWDVLTFPITSAREIGELNEILIDRISPQDAHALKGFDGSESLKGTGFGHFAAFFSRAYRENDYLLGPPPCSRPADRHRLRRRRDRARCGRDRRTGAQAARPRPHSRCRGAAPHPQQAADREFAATPRRARRVVAPGGAGACAGRRPTRRARRRDRRSLPATGRNCP